MVLPDIMKMYPSIDATEAVEKVGDKIRYLCLHCVDLTIEEPTIYDLLLIDLSKDITYRFCKFCFKRINVVYRQTPLKFYLTRNYVCVNRLSK